MFFAVSKDVLFHARPSRKVRGVMPVVFLKEVEKLLSLPKPQPRAISFRGIEVNFNDFRPIHSLVLEYLQTTNQSGPLHGLHNPGEGPVQKVSGSDNYYNNGLYHGWAHAGMANGNPLLRSPIYNEDGNMTFKYNRVKAMHMGWSGYMAREWDYVAKLSFSRTWGTYPAPTLDILENFSAYAAFRYVPAKLKGWQFCASFGLDMGEIYGDNVGFQMKIHKTF